MTPETSKNSEINTGTTRLLLSNDRWIEARNELTARERRRLSVGVLKGQRLTASGDRFIDAPDSVADQSFHAAMAWITDWNLTEHDGKAVPCTADALGSRPDWLFDEIEAALEKHIEDQKTAAKNAMSASSKS